MKIRKWYHVLIIIFVCACTGLNGWFFGQAGGDAGAIIGAVTGVIAGILFLRGYYDGKKIGDRRLRKAEKLGALYGGISGFLVHVPNIFRCYILGEEHVFKGIAGNSPIFIGPIVGIVSGTILGLVLGFILSLNSMETEDNA